MAGKYKLTFGRKFFSLLFGTLILCYLYTITVIKAPEAVSPLTLIVAVSALVLLCMAYIGGNMYSSFIKSKYFHSELIGQ